MSNQKNDKEKDAVASAVDAIVNAPLYKLLNAMVEVYPLAKMRHRYVDYDEGTWTIPCDLKHHRIDKILTDLSVEKIQIKRNPETNWETFDPFEYKGH